MASSSTLVSVVIPTCNRAAILPATIDSVLGQTHPNLELIVVDDGSTDATEDVAARYRGRLRYVKQANQGVEAARREGLRVSSGRYVNFLDDDDLMAPAKIARQVALLGAHPEMGAVHCRYHFIDRDGSWMETTGRMPEGNVLKQLVWGCFPWSGGPLVRRECLEQIDPCEHRDWHGDWGMWLRIALAGYQFGCVQEPLGSYRMLRGSMIDAKIANAERLVFNILEQVFSRWTMPSEIVAERDQIYGGWHFWISCRYYIGGFWDEAKRNLARVLALRPELRREPQMLLDLFYHDAVSPRGRVYDPLRFLAAVWEHLPPEADFLGPYRAPLLARLHVALALRSRAGGNHVAAVEQLREGLRLDPGILVRPDGFAGWLSSYASSLPHLAPEAFVEAVAHDLPASRRVRRQIRARALADLGVTSALRGYAEGRGVHTARSALMALRHRPCLVLHGVRRLARSAVRLLRKALPRRASGVRTS